MSVKEQQIPKVRMAETPQEQEQWLAQWRLAEAGLLEVKREEMRALSESGAIAFFNALDTPPEFGWRSPAREQSLGFVEQQRIFGKAPRH